jgi:hypothetical protein
LNIVDVVEEEDVDEEEDIDEVVEQVTPSGRV